MHQSRVREERIGFIGLGVMGQPMALNLVASGRRLTIFNRSASLDRLVAAGATLAAHAREVAAQADVVILMLPDSPDVEQVTMGDDGLLAGLQHNTLIIDMSTISPVVTRRLAAIVEARGAHWVDAPVSGGDKGAVAGTLSIMVGGRAEDVERARPLLDVMGTTVVHLGPVGAGQSVKAANQIVVGAVFQALAEALNLTDRAGIDRDKVIEVLQGGLAHTRCLELRKENYLARSFEPGFRIELHHKDLGIALEAGRAAGVPMPVTSLVREFMGSMVARGHGRMDHSGLYEFVSANARVLGEEAAAPGAVLDQS